MQTSPANPECDELDRMIVEVLREDGRLSVPSLAERVGVSRATAYARFSRLVGSGLISGFRAVVDPSVLGLRVAALVLIRAEQPRWAGTLERLRATQGVEWVGLAASRFDFVALVRAADLTELRDVVLRSLREVPGLTSTETVILLDEAGPAPGPPDRAGGPSRAERPTRPA
jgi:DNA-binding Lrp family transcriptional regulator